MLAKYTVLTIWEVALILGVTMFSLHRLVDIFLYFRGCRRRGFTVTTIDTNMENLYRNEAVKNSSTRLFGKIVISNSVSNTVLTYGVLFSIAVIVLYLVLATYSRKQIVSGYVLPNKGALKVYAPYLGTIERKLILDGDYINKGDVLLEVSTGKFNGTSSTVNEQLIKEIETRISNLLDRAINEEELFIAEQKQLEEKIANLSDELSHIYEQIRTQNKLVVASKEEWGKYKGFRKRGLVREADVTARQTAYLNNQSSLESINRVKLNKELELSQAKNQLKQLPVNIEQRKGELESTLAQLQERIIELKGASSYTVRAPVSGRVTALQVNTGQTVDASKPLLTIIPEDTVLYAELYLPSRAIGFVDEGQKVLLRYDAFPYQRYGLYEGRISKIASAVINPNEASMPVHSQEPVYKVNVELKDQFIKAYGKNMPLQSGMSVNADIILDERSLGEWLLAPLYSLRGRI